MIGKTFAVLALTASIGAFTISPSLASSKSTTENSPWYDTNSNAALSRANLSEKVLSRAAVIKVKYLRSVVGPPLRLKPPPARGRQPRRHRSW